MTISESNAIHNLRVFALMLIVSCHICQFYGNRWAWVLNVGVQLFIIISGYLYGQRIVTDWSEWFKNRFLKLYILYALYLCVVLPLYFIFESSYISIKKVVLYFFDLQGILGGVKGLGHLWYMTAIALCYLITPFLQFLHGNGKGLVLLIVCFGCLDFYVFHCRFHYITLYALTYSIAAGTEMDKIKVIGVMIVSFALTYLVSWDDLVGKAPLGYLWRCSVAVLIFSVVIIMSRVCTFRLFSTTQCLSAYSYYIYIVHHLPIMLPFSILALDIPFPIRSVLLVLAISVSAYVLKEVSERSKILYDTILKS